ncbi:MAG: hypothetical protein GYB65_01625 [Chloroflexi bacterium]|nr:hypothetical protein [Chloroflexota bacterium]
MPIDDTQLDKATNAHVLCPAQHTVHQALRAWRKQSNSYEWWWLIIEGDNRRYTATRFEELREMLAHADLNVGMNTRLADLPPRRSNPADWDRPFPGVVTPTVTEQSALGTARALQTMQDSPGQVLVVLHEGRFRGILSASQRTFAFADKPLMDMLEEFETGGDEDTLILPPRDDEATAQVPTVPDDSPG